MKAKIIAVIAAIALIVFVAKSAKVIEKGTEAQYTGVAVFDAKASSSSDWDKIAAEISANAADITTLDISTFGAGKAVIIKGTVSAYDSKANGRRNTITIAPDNYTGSANITVQLGSIYTGTAVRDIQTLKTFGDFTNQTEWSQYAKALNSQIDSAVVSPLAIKEDIKGKHVTVTGAATASGNNVTVTPVAIVID